MLKAGTPAKAIVAKIKTSPCNFDKSAKALDELRAADAPYPVIAAMMHAASPDDELRSETPASQPAPLSAPSAKPEGTAVAAAPKPEPAPAPSIPAPVAPQPPAPPVAKSDPPGEAPVVSLGHRPAANSMSPAGMIEVTIPDSTLFLAKPDEDLTSSKIRASEFVFFSVAEDVKIDGITVIAEGAPVRALVIDAKKSRSWGRGARIFMTMQDVRAVDGELMPVRASNDLRGRDTNQKMKNAAIATGQISWALAPLWGLSRGGAVGIPAGTKFEVYTYGVRKLKVKPAAQTPPPSN